MVELGSHQDARTAGVAERANEAADDEGRYDIVPTAREMPLREPGKRRRDQDRVERAAQSAHAMEVGQSDVVEVPGDRPAFNYPQPRAAI